MKRFFEPANLVRLSLLVAGLGLPVSFVAGCRDNYPDEEENKFDER